MIDYVLTLGGVTDRGAAFFIFCAFVMPGVAITAGLLYQHGVIKDHD